MDGNTTRVTFSAKLRRALDFTLHIRNADGGFQTKEQTLDAPDEMTYEDYTLTFDITDVTLSRDAGGFLELVVTDTHNGYTRDHLFARHQFVGVEHNGGTRWFNNDVFDVQNFRQEGGKIISKTPERYTCLIASEDNGNQRTVSLVSRVNSNGEVFGVSATVDKGFVRQYRNSSRSWRTNHQHRWECHWATRVGHLKELARKTDAAITDVGIAGDIGRLNALGDLIRMAIPYGTPIHEECPPITVLHENTGDCSEKSALMAGNLANDPWNVRTGYIDCELSATPHLTIGIDQRDFETGGREGIFRVDAGNSGPRPPTLPDTEYAFFEMTNDSELGEAEI